MKLTLSDISTFQNDNTAVSNYNKNNTATENAMENTLSRDGTSPNQMESNLDMNSWHIINLPEPSSDTDPIRKIDLTSVSQVTNVLHTASSTSNTIGLGNKTFTVPSGLGFFAGQYILVQYSIDNTNYMLGRVVSYSGSTLVVNSQVISGSGTYSNWTIDLSGPQGPVSAVYDTKANAQAATIPSSQSYLSLSGYTTVGDGGNGLYKRQVSNPGTTTGSFFQSADGAYWLLVSNIITPEMFGCIGDGVTDCATNFQNAITYTASRGGGWIYLTPSKTYRFVLTDISMNNGVNVGIRFNGSTINMECTGNSMGFRQNTGCRLIGPGTLAVTSSVTPSGSQGAYHATITFGELNGNEGSVGSPSPLTTINNIVIDGLTITNARTDHTGAIISGLGGIHDITIQNCIFPDNSGAATGIGFDWGFYGTLQSANIAQSRINYDAGTAYSIHPHNVKIINNQIGNMTAPNPGGGSNCACGIRVSGVYNFLIEGNDIQSTTCAGIYHTGGDLSFEFAPSEVRLNACANNIIRRNNIHNYTGLYGIIWDAFPDNVYDAVTNPANPSYPYSPIFYYDGYFVNSVIENNRVYTRSFINTGSGILCSYTRGLTISNNILLGAIQGQYGINLTNGCKYVKVLNNDISQYQQPGIYILGGTSAPERCIVEGNYVHRSCSATSTLGMIYIGNGISHCVRVNQVGDVSEDLGTVGIQVDTGCTAALVVDNVVKEVKTAGIPFVFTNNTSNTTIWEAHGNRYGGNQTTTFISGLPVIPYRRDYSLANSGKVITHATAQRSALTGGTTPPGGQWEVGSTLQILDAASAQVYISRCTVAGTPGTWAATVTNP